MEQRRYWQVRKAQCAPLKFYPSFPISASDEKMAVCKIWNPLVTKGALRYYHLDKYNSKVKKRALSSLRSVSWCGAGLGLTGDSREINWALSSWGHQSISSSEDLKKMEDSWEMAQCPANMAIPRGGLYPPFGFLELISGHRWDVYQPSSKCLMRSWSCQYRGKGRSQPNTAYILSTSSNPFHNPVRQLLFPFHRWQDCSL